MSRVMLGLLAALLAGGGAYQLLAAFPGQQSPREVRDAFRPLRLSVPGFVGFDSPLERARKRLLHIAGRRVPDRLSRPDDRALDVALVGIVLASAVVGSLAGLLLFASWPPALVSGACAATFPLGARGLRQEAIRLENAQAWPALIEEIRLRTGSLGRSVPQALFEAGRRAPRDWRPAFEAAEREWLLSTDFERTLTWLRSLLNDPGADVLCEALAVGHELGGPSLGQRLEALAEDRAGELQGRKDALARSAGVRFARRFVLLVPLGMALAGLSIGTGPSAYQSGAGQLAASAAVVAVTACWAWSARLVKIPQEPRIFL